MTLSKRKKQRQAEADEARIEKIMRQQEAARDADDAERRMSDAEFWIDMEEEKEEAKANRQNDPLSEVLK